MTAVNLPPMDSPRALDARPVVSVGVASTQFSSSSFFFFAGLGHLTWRSLFYEKLIGCGASNALLIATRVSRMRAFTGGRPLILMYVLYSAVTLRMFSRV